MDPRGSTHKHTHTYTQRGKDLFIRQLERSLRYGCWLSLSNFIYILVYIVSEEV